MKNDLHKRALVTGGAGFLGSHLCERLLRDGREVLCVDNYYTGSRAHIARLLANPWFEALRHDITFPLYVEVDCISLLKEGRWPACVAYEEPLYRLKPGLMQARLCGLREEEGIRATPLCASLPRRDKAAAVACYKSQLIAFGDGCYDDVLAAERYWLLEYGRE